MDDAERGRWLLVTGRARRRLPVSRWDHSDVSIKTRAAVVPFENRWQLSVIWGGATYSTNHDYMGPIPGWRETENQPFIERPAAVEVGVLCPEPIILPPLMTPETAEVMAEHSPVMRAAIDGADRSWLFEERETALWGDPLAYVDADGLVRLADAVARLPSHPSAEQLAGAEFDDVDGFVALVRERFGVPTNE